MSETKKVIEEVLYETYSKLLIWFDDKVIN